MDMQIAKEILTAVEAGDLEKVDKLIGSDKERLNFTTSVFGTWLHIAAKRGKLNIVKYLIKSGMDVNRRGGISDSYAINQAITYGHIEIVKYLLSCGAEMDVSDPVRNPLFDAITDGHVDIVKLLIDTGIDIYVKYDNGRDALAYAIERGQNEIADLLRIAMGQRSIAKQQNVDIEDDNQGQHDEILKYISKNCGKISQTISEIVPGSRVTVNLHIIPASKERNYITLVTTGMSDYPMDEAEEAGETAYAELLIKLPADWPMEQKKMKDEKNYWPLGWLRQTAHIPHLYDGVLEAEIILPNGEPPMPFASNTKLSCIMVCKPKEAEMKRFVTPKGKIINFYSLIPIYEEERNIVLSRGDFAIIKLDH
ncbi:hypothetical protein SRRS_11870 [Sporomusa rhizae]|uniref:suppressor of fused domain protein n=1 Tax=Sporomusa rhizae TaxID=357999 RepID=UPI00352BA11F